MPRLLMIDLALSTCTRHLQAVGDLGLCAVSCSRKTPSASAVILSLQSYFHFWTTANAVLAGLPASVAPLLRAFGMRDCRQELLLPLPIMVAVCVTENDHLYFASSFFQTLFLRRLWTDFLETSPHDVGSSAIDNVPFTSR